MFYGRLEDTETGCVLRGKVTAPAPIKIFHVLFFCVFFCLFLYTTYRVLMGEDGRWYLPLIMGGTVFYIATMSSFMFRSDYLHNKVWFEEEIVHAVMQTQRKY